LLLLNLFLQILVCSDPSWWLRGWQIVSLFHQRNFACSAFLCLRLWIFEIQCLWFAQLMFIFHDWNKDAFRIDFFNKKSMSRAYIPWRFYLKGIFNFILSPKIVRHFGTFFNAFSARNHLCFPALFRSNHEIFDGNLLCGRNICSSGLCFHDGTEATDAKDRSDSTSCQNL
jgi:hypothetical protein